MRELANGAIEFIWEKVGTVYDRKKHIASVAMRELQASADGDAPLPPPLFNPPTRPLRHNYLAKQLRAIDFQDEQFISDLENIDALGGFPLRSEITLSKDELTPNSKACYKPDNVLLIHEKLRDEWLRQQHAGPFTLPQLRRFIWKHSKKRFVRNLPILIVVKCDVDGTIKTRVCSNASSKGDRGQWQSLNEATRDIPICFDSVTDAVEAARRIQKASGQTSTLFAKIDLCDAFHQLPVAWKDYNLNVFSWFDVRKNIPHNPSPASPHMFYVGLTCCFGHKSSVHHFHKLSHATKALLLHPDTPHLVNRVPQGKKDAKTLLDDTLGIAAIGHGVTLREEMLQVFVQYGLGVSFKKVIAEGAVEASKEFLGVVLDSVRSESRMSEKRVKSCTAFANDLLGKVRIKFKRFESFVGLMSFASLGVPVSRCHLRRLYSRLALGPDSSGYVSLSKPLRDDVKFFAGLWKLKYNKQSWKAIEAWSAEPDDEFFTDAAQPQNTQAAGYGATFQNMVFGHGWNNKIAAPGGLLAIAHLELAGILIALNHWKTFLLGKKIHIRCDNTAACAAVQNGSSSDPAMALLARRILQLAMMEGFALKVSHIKGVDNEFGDLPSRLRWADFANHYNLSPLRKKYGPFIRQSVDEAFSEGLLNSCCKAIREHALGSRRRRVFVAERLRNARRRFR